MKQEITLKEIRKIIEQYTNIDISCNIRHNDYVKARCIYYKLARKYTRCSFIKIGKEVNKHHASVIHGINIFDTFDDENMTKLYNRIEKSICKIYGFENENTKEEIEINKLKKQITHLKSELIKEGIKRSSLIKNVSKYEAINELLSLEHSDILDCIKYKIEPHLKMLKTKVTNKDLLDFQKQTRKL